MALEEGKAGSRLENSMELALQSTREGEWLTDVAQRKYFELLQKRSTRNSSNCMFLSADFLQGYMTWH